MELRLLQYFLTVVREENISRAAELLHITQPTLSRGIQKLEEELGAQLFIRGRRITLTDAGVMLRRRAEEVAALVDKIDAEFEEKRELAGVISIGTGGFKAFGALPRAMEGFRARWPRVRFRIHTNSSEYIKERIEQGLLDFALLMEPVDVSKFDYVRLPGRERWGLLVSAGNPLASRASVSADGLRGLPLITTDRLPVQRELESRLGINFSELEIFATYNIITSAAEIVAAGAACALTIEGVVSLFDPAKVVFVPLEPELSMAAVLAWKKFQPNFGAAGAFLDYLKSMQ
ncbi:MAG TPA: LysR family transcriptional regulator [Candidatus Caccocola faecipullorum]|nr:LysR family transcriptional regulator [Candidatus Caccocola faecipullorum]